MAKGFGGMNCSIAGALDLVGERWSLLILRDAFLGVTRFADFRSRLGIAPNVLTTRLDALVGAGVLERRAYDPARDRADYVLTAKGRDLWPVLVTLRQWGDRWVSGEGAEPVVLEHRGHRTVGRLVCDDCGEVLEPRDLRNVAGPGLTDPALIEHRAPPAPPDGQG
jgi:DNA-binding HxlR family transcriptional regulator